MAKASWCDTCARSVPADGVDDAGRCKACGNTVTGLADEPGELAGSAEDMPPRRIPWHFKLLGAATVVYLGYRAYQGIEWLIHHL